MAVKFPLEMANSVQARTLKDLKENFDVARIVGYFLDGKLHSWLESHYYEEIADLVSQIDKNDSDLARKLCEIFGVEYIETETIDAEELMERNKRIEKLKQFTDDEEIIKNIDLVAFNQKELSNLYDSEIQKIYLCEGKFNVPKNKLEIDYIVLGNACVDIPDKLSSDIDILPEQVEYHPVTGMPIVSKPTHSTIFNLGIEALNEIFDNMWTESKKIVKDNDQQNLQKELEE